MNNYILNTYLLKMQRSQNSPWHCRKTPYLVHNAQLIQRNRMIDARHLMWLLIFSLIHHTLTLQFKYLYGWTFLHCISSLCVYCRITDPSMKWIHSYSTFLQQTSTLLLHGKRQTWYHVLLETLYVNTKKTKPLVTCTKNGSSPTVHTEWWYLQKCPSFIKMNW